MPSKSLGILFRDFVKSEPDLEEMLSWIRDNCNPEDVFPSTELDKWAESEGYTKPENNG